MLLNLCLLKFFSQYNIFGGFKCHLGDYIGLRGREVSIYFKAHPSISLDAGKLLTAVFSFLLSPFNVKMP